MSHICRVEEVVFAFFIYSHFSSRKFVHSRHISLESLGHVIGD